MAAYGYARVSTTDQDVTLQVEALKAAGCTMVRSEQVTGTKRHGRTQLQLIMEFAQAGDTLTVTRIDQLARSVRDLQDIVHELKARGVTLKATEQPIDTSTAAGKALLDMLGVFAEFETNLRKERQLEGIAKAKAVGVYKGRPPTIDAEAVREMRARGLGPKEIANRLGRRPDHQPSPRPRWRRSEAGAAGHRTSPAAPHHRRAGRTWMKRPAPSMSHDMVNGSLSAGRAVDGGAGGGDPAAGRGRRGDRGGVKAKAPGRVPSPRRPRQQIETAKAPADERASPAGICFVARQSLTSR
jgi:DNA invertase Pin-like site-specific DNA recombinase